MADLAYLSAGEALAMFRTRELSPAEVLDALIARDEAIGSDVNAFAWRFFDEARAAAKRAEARYMERGPAPRPLEGIAVAVKENQAIAGLPLTHASLLLADAVASATAPVPQRVLDAGGIVHARTTMAEFGTHWATHSRLFGVTRNPWNLEYDVGGSSGGSAAALAAGTATLGHRGRLRGIAAHARRLLRGGRLQAPLRPGADPAHEQLRHLPRTRADGAHRRGLRAAP